MKEQTPTEFLTELYNNAMSVVGSKETITSDLTQNEKELLDLVLNYSEQARAVLTVIITSLTRSSKTFDTTCGIIFSLPKK